VLQKPQRRDRFYDYILENKIHFRLRSARGILAAEVLMGCSGEFFGARELPQLDVGLQVLHHAGELT